MIASEDLTDNLILPWGVDMDCWMAQNFTHETQFSAQKNIGYPTEELTCITLIYIPCQTGLFYARFLI